MLVSEKIIIIGKAESHCAAGDFLKYNVTGVHIRLKGHGRVVTRDTPGVQTHRPSYVICIYCLTSFFPNASFRSSIFLAEPINEAPHGIYSHQHIGRSCIYTNIQEQKNKKKTYNNAISAECASYDELVHNAISAECASYDELVHQYVQL